MESNGVSDLKTGTESKLKFKQLQRKLDLPLWQARGLLDTLWTFVRDNCPAGDIGRFTDDEIAIGLDWRGCAASLIAILVETRWLDLSPVARLVVHDWREHCEDSVHKSLARKTECFWDGSMPSLTRFPVKERRAIEQLYKRAFQNAQERSQTLKNAPTEPNRTEPNGALPSLTAPGAAPSPLEEKNFMGDRSDRPIGAPRSTPAGRSPIESFDLSEIDWGLVARFAESAAKRVPVRNDKDRRAWIRYAVMACTTFSEAWLADAAEAVANAKETRATRQAHFVAVLQSKAAEQNVDAETFNSMARRIEIPVEVWKSDVLGGPRK